MSYKAIVTWQKKKEYKYRGYYARVSKEFIRRLRMKREERTWERILGKIS